jgi:dTDP-4-amino-4,6-dideoxygalactose transaminase
MRVPFLDVAAMHAEVEAELDFAWRQVSRSGRFIGGAFVERFETAWADYCGVTHCVGVASGTAALQLALEALGIGPGDEVILPANTFFATAEAVLAAGATPAFVDVDPATLLMTAAGVAAAITPRTAAVIAVHLYGQPVDMDALERVAEAAGIVVLEDAAQAHGATWRGRRAGSMSRVGCFSFYPGKNLGALGDAGAVVTNDRVLAERVRSLSNHGRPGDRQDGHYQHVRVGGTHRLDALQAALLSAKLPHLEAWNAGRRRAARLYEQALAELPLEPVRTAEGAISSHHLAVVQLSGRDNVRRHLGEDGIDTAVHYPTPCHLLPALASGSSPKLPVVERAAGRIMSLPMFPHLTDSAVARVADAIGRALTTSETRP